MTDGNDKNNFRPACEGTELLECTFLRGLSKSKRDEWLLKLDIKLSKAKSCKKTEEEVRSVAKEMAKDITKYFKNESNF